MASANILLVDDEEDFRFIFTRQVTRILQDLQLEFFEAGDGEEALELLRTGVKPSIIILDYTMPRMSGTELLKTIDREHGDLVNVPRLVLSGYIGEDAIREVKSLRCDYMEKSMNTKIFYQRFCRYLTDKLGLPPLNRNGKKSQTDRLIPTQAETPSRAMRRSQPVPWNVISQGTS